MTNDANKPSKRRQHTDMQLIEGLKKGDKRIVKLFFYDLCQFTLKDIQRSIFKGALSYDDLVGELYIYLSANEWARLDSFKALNGCTLKSWMVTLAWRFFIQNRRRLLGDPVDDIEDADPLASDDEIRHEMMMDIHLTLARMPNARYAEMLRMVLIDGYTYEECALRMNTTVKNLYNVKHRAISQFISCFG